MQIVVVAFGRAIELKLGVVMHGKGTDDETAPEFINLSRVDAELADDDDEPAQPFGFGKR